MSSLLEISLSGYLLASNLLPFVFCFFIAIYIRVSLENKNNSHSRFFLKRAITLVIMGLTADMVSYAVNTQRFFSARFLSHLSMFVSTLTTASIGFFWNRFFDVIFRINDRPRLRRCLYFFPIAAVGLLLIVNLFTGIFYSIDAENVYARGPLALISFALQYVSFAVLVIRAFFHKFPVRTLRYMKLRNGFALLGIVALSFGLLQILASGKIALQCFGMTAGIFIMFSRFQDDQITNDILTSLNNRHALDAYIADKIKDYADGMHGRRQLYLIMMDVNYFKRINDIYGHIEGDKALRIVAATLKKVGGSYKSELFVARFGGDEFSAVFESDSERRVRQLCSDIKSSLKNDTEDLKYRLTIGVGYALYTGKSMTIDELCERADKALYEDKARVANGETDT